MKVPGQEDLVPERGPYYHTQAHSVVCLGDSTLAMVGEEDIVLHDLKRQQPLRRLRSPGGAGKLLAVSADGRYLASAPSGPQSGRPYDPMLRVYETASGQEVLCRRLPEHTAAGALAFVPGKPLLLMGMTDSTVLLWDVGGPDAQSTGESEPLASLWQEMAHPEARRAYQAMVRLMAAPGAAEYLNRRLGPLPEVPAPRRDRLLSDLENSDFLVRESASRELAGWGERILSDLERALAVAHSPEARRRLERLVSPPHAGAVCDETLRQLRAVAVLEYLATPAARKLLKRLSEDGTGSRLAREARAAWQRSDPGRR